MSNPSAGAMKRALERATGSPLSIQRVPISSLHLDPANARAHPERNMAAIQASLARFGQVEPLVVQQGTRRVIGGNGRLAAMRAMGWSEVDIVELELESIDAAALGIALNRTADLAAWDETALGEILRTLRVEDALEGVGFDEREVDDLLAGLEGAADGSLIDDPGAGEPPKQAVTQLGDLWILGTHRLLCGDSTKPDDIARLMAGQQASLLATDPPYLVNYAADNHPPSSCNSPATANKNWDEYKDPESGLAFFDGFLKACLPHVREDAAIYQWHASRRQVLVEEAWKLNGLLLHQTLLWVKARAVLTRSMFMWRHEPCFFGWRQGHMPPKDRRPPCNETTVWEIDQVSEDRPDHPTVKPLEIFTRPQQWHARRGEICLEPFSGSGSQIIAAQATDRRCFAMELAPGYVDVALRRWEKATGREAVLDEGGSTFAQTAKARGVEVEQ